jgi:hypothetical protein
MYVHVAYRRVILAAVLIVISAVSRTLAAEKYSAADRLALREFRMNRLFSLLGYLEQRATNVGFPWKEVGYGEAANAWSGLSTDGTKLAPPVIDLPVSANTKPTCSGSSNRTFPALLLWPAASSTAVPTSHCTIPTRIWRRTSRHASRLRRFQQRITLLPPKSAPIHARLPLLRRASR